MWSELFCLIICALHIITELIVSAISHKKIERICSKCLAPIVEGESHDCLNNEQLQALTSFIKTLRGD